MAMNIFQVAYLMDVSYLIFKTVDSRDAVAKATGTHTYRVLKVG